MFKKAQIKLTFAYLTIIMVITLSFSTVVYNGVVSITERAFQNQKDRIERRLRELNYFSPNPRAQFAFIVRDEDALSEVRGKTLDILILINLVILAGAGTLGYYFAGRTLKPIEIMTKQQKRFISDAAHELKTPLTAIKTELEVTARDKNLDVEQSKLTFTSAVEEIDKLSNFINKLLKKSKYQNGEATEVKSFVIKQKLETLVSKYKSLADKTDQKIIISGDEIKIITDESAFDELFTNLLDNAIKYNKHGETINIKVYKKGKDVEISIEDHGIGISEEDMKHIFEPFYRANKSRSKNEYEGFGLGLAITKEIVDKLKGKISVKSEVDEGTIFTVILPTQG